MCLFTNAVFVLHPGQILPRSGCNGTPVSLSEKRFSRWRNSAYLWILLYFPISLCKSLQLYQASIDGSKNENMNLSYDNWHYSDFLEKLWVYRAHIAYISLEGVHSFGIPSRSTSHSLYLYCICTVLVLYLYCTCTVLVLYL